MLDLAIVSLFVLYSLSAGVSSRRSASKGLNEYFLAGRSLSGASAGCSMAATQFAADTPLLVTGLIATGGVFLLWRLWIYGVAFLLLAFLFAPLWRRAKVLTDAEFSELRYSGGAAVALRGVKAVYYGGVINCAVLAMVLVAALRITEVFLPWHSWLPAELYSEIVALLNYLPIPLGESVTGLSEETHRANSLLSIGAILLFVAAYSTTGGLRAVVVTDVMQLTIALVGTLAYAWVLVAEIGSLQALRDRLGTLYGAASDRFISFAPPADELMGSFLMLVGLQWLFQMNSDGTGYLAQRTMACRSDRDARVAAVLFAWLQIVLRSAIWLVIGVGLLVIYPLDMAGARFSDEVVAGRELLFVTGIKDLLPAGLRGLMLTALLAALASTVDTHLNWGASYFSNDLYQRILCMKLLRRTPRAREMVIVARLSSIAVLLLSLVVMANLSSIQAAWQLSLLFGAGVGGVLVLRWLWERINVYSEFAAMLSSLALAPPLLYYIEDDVMRLLLMALGSTTAVVISALVAPSSRPEVLDRFYLQVRPVGWWTKTALRVAGAEEARRSRAEFERAMFTTALASLSLFAMLVGIGKLLLTPGLFGAALVVFSLLLVPLWWPAVIRAEEGSVVTQP